MRSNMDGFLARWISASGGAALGLLLLLSSSAWAGEEVTTLSVGRSVSTCSGLTSNAYKPSEPLTIAITFTKEGPAFVTGLAYTESIPSGWTFGALLPGASAPAGSPNPGATGTLEFFWISPPALPYTLSFTVVPNEASTGEKCLTGSAEYRLGGGALFANPGQTCIQPIATCPVLTSCVTLSRSLPTEYVPGQPVAVTVDLASTCVLTPEALSVQEDIPDGWTVSDVQGVETPTNAPEEGVLDFSFATIPAFPASFSYVLTPPVDSAGAACIVGVVHHTVAGTELTSSQRLNCLTGPSCVSYTRSEVRCPEPGTSFDVTITIEETCSANLTALSVTETMPPGWSYGGLVGDGPGIYPSMGATGDLAFAYITAPALPVSFTYTVNVPPNNVEPFLITGEAQYRTVGVAEFSDTVVSATCDATVTCDLALNGDQTLNVTCGSAFTDPGATATCDPALPPDYRLETDSGVNINAPGSYQITYTLFDSLDAPVASISRVVNVSDATAPSLALVGAATQTIQCGTAFTDPGATATDSCAGAISSSIVRTGTVVTTSPGSYTLTYNVSDPSGNAAAPVSRTVTVEDTTAPVVTLVGASTISHPFLQPFTDPGATAADACNGNLTGSIVKTGTVNVQVAGDYTLTYEATDATGNKGSVTRTVTVQEGPPPTITLVGASPLFLECGGTFTDPGATATDVLDGDITAQIEASGNVDVNEPGIYARTYKVTNSRNQTSAIVTRAIAVQDSKAPVVSLLGAAEVTVECGTSYTDAGATADDQCEGDVTASIVAAQGKLLADTAQKLLKAGEAYVNTGAPGTYRISFTAEDATGNVSVPAVRTVNVVDTIAPAITLIGAAEVITPCAVPYVDGGATASDSCAGDLTADIALEGTVDTSAPGTYTVTHRVSDPAGNEASVTRTVVVVDAVAPVVTLIGDDFLDVVCGGVFLDPGATAEDDCDTAVGVSDNSETIDTNTPGIYVVTYTAEDASGNIASISRDVEVLECEGEGEGEPEGEGEGEPDPCALDPVDTFTVVAPTAGITYLLHDNARSVSVPLRAAFTFTEACPQGSVRVTYEVNGQIAGNSLDLENGFPVTVQSNIGEYVVVATATVLDYNYSISATSTFLVKRGLDVNSNGFLDNPFDLDPDAAWNAEVSGGASDRVVGIVHWVGESKGDDTENNLWGKQASEIVTITLVNPSLPGQQLTVDARRDLARAGESAVLMVSLSDSIDSLLSPADTTAVVASVPESPIAGAAYFDINIIVSTDGGATYAALPAERLAGNPLSFSLSGLDPDPEKVANFFRYPTEVISTQAEGVEVVPVEGDWTNSPLQNVMRNGDVLTAEATALALFAPIEQLNVLPRVSISPNPGGTYNFGEIIVDTKVTQTFTVTNIGGLQLNGQAVLTDASGTFALEGPTSYSLANANGESVDIVLSFTPLAAATYAAELRFTGGDQGDVVIQVRGEGSDKQFNFFGCGAASNGRGMGRGDVLVILLMLAGLAGALRLHRTRQTL